LLAETDAPGYMELSDPI